MTDQNRTTDQRSAHDGERSSASRAYASSKQSTKDVAQKTAAAIESNPLAVLAGGIAVGAIAGALIPRSAREKEMLAPLGRRLSETARQAFAAAKEAGQQELDGAGLNKGAARDQGKQLLDGVAKALSSAGAAAAGAAKQQNASRQDASQQDASRKDASQQTGRSAPTFTQSAPSNPPAMSDAEPPLAGI